MDRTADPRRHRADQEWRPSARLPGQRVRQLLLFGVPTGGPRSGAGDRVSAVLVWQWRPHRGPVLVAALAIGSAAAAGAAAGVGALLVRSRYDVIDIAGAPISPEDRAHYVTEAPPVFFAHTPLLIAATILFPGRDGGVGLRADRGVDVARRSGRVAAGRAARAQARHSGRRSTVRPVTTFAAMRTSLAMPR